MGGWRTTGGVADSGRRQRGSLASTTAGDLMDAGGPGRPAYVGC